LTKSLPTPSSPQNQNATKVLQILQKTSISVIIAPEFCFQTPQNPTTYKKTAPFLLKIDENRPKNLFWLDKIGYDD
jgi:esterase/lipase